MDRKFEQLAEYESPRDECECLELPPPTYTHSPITYIIPPGNWTPAICGTVQCSYVTSFIQLNTILNTIRLLVILNFLSLIHC